MCLTDFFTAFFVKGYPIAIAIKLTTVNTINCTANLTFIKLSTIETKAPIPN